MKMSDENRLMYDKARFESKIKKQKNGCWIWTAGKNIGGYADFWYEGKSQRGHRCSYLLYNGKIPKGIYVCHKCDTPSCVNPDHLFLGTPKDNTQDAVVKGRLTWKLKNKRISPKKTLEERKQISERMKGNKIWLGKKHSQATKEKITNLLLGHKVSNESKLKMRAAKIGRKLSEETRKKMSEAQKRRQKK